MVYNASRLAKANSCVDHISSPKFSGDELFYIGVAIWIYVLQKKEKNIS